MDLPDRLILPKTLEVRAQRRVQEEIGLERFHVENVIIALNISMKDSM
jgi:hypothetical protein